MNNAQMNALLERWHRQELALRVRKGHDYASADDIFGNFRRVHQICKTWDIQPGQRQADVFLYYIILKIDRACNLLHNGKAAQNESLDDTMQDLRVYLDLLRAYLTEGNDGTA